MCQDLCIHTHSPSRGKLPTRPSGPPSQPADGAPDYQDLLHKSVAARETAYAPNSNFKVGAALLARDGTVYTGSNKELTINADHAEQSAIHKALIDGQQPQDLVAIAIFGARGEVADASFKSRTPACGNCRQALGHTDPLIAPLHHFAEQLGARVGDDHFVDQQPLAPHHSGSRLYGRLHRGYVSRDRKKGLAAHGHGQAHFQQLHTG